MATERQIEANRQNALSSTGPRSDAGKARSAQNALIHGVTARRALLPGEDGDIFDALYKDLFKKFQPDGPIETEMVASAASLMWRLRRIPAFEIALFHWISRFQGFSLPINTDAVGQSAEFKSSNIGYVLETMVSKDVLGKLTRYETTLTKQLKQTIYELQKFIEKRSDELVSSRKVVTISANLAANTDAPSSVERQAESTAR